MRKSKQLEKDLNRLFSRMFSYEILLSIPKSIFSYKDCPSFDLDKLLEDVQNGLYPITAYHLLFPTHSTLSLLTKSSILDKVLTASSSYSSFPSSTLTNNDNEAIISIQSTTDPLVFYPIHSNDSNGTSIMTNGIRARNANPTYERSTSVLSVPEHHPVDSTSTIINSNSSPSSTNQEEKENRRILDIQSKIKSKETGSYLVSRTDQSINPFFTNSFSVIHQCEISRSITTRYDC